MNVFSDSLGSLGFSFGKYMICVPFPSVAGWGRSPNPDVFGTLEVTAIVPGHFCVATSRCSLQ